MTQTLHGVVERITFHNESTGYCVLRVKVDGRADLATIVGYSPTILSGEYVHAEGEWVHDRQHGPQFRATTIRTTPPHTPEGIIKYLSSRWVKGIGPTYARKIVEVFGEKTLEVIDQSPAFLSQVKGIGPKRLQLIRAGWAEQKHVRSIMVFLSSYGIGPARAVKIYKAYGDRAIEMVKSNPYRLSTDIWGVGFQTADDLALKLGVPRHSPHRAKAAVRHVLQQAALEGHVALPESLLYEQARQLTRGEIDEATLSGAVQALLSEEELVREPALAGEAANHAEATAAEGEEAFLYLRPLYLAECGVARGLATLAKAPPPLSPSAADDALAWAENRMGLAFSPSQRQAIRTALSSPFCVLTGGPGTGKTTLLRAILDILQAQGRQVALCAPTGRAAKRLSEATGGEARTIHRLLEFDPARGEFRRQRQQPLDADALIVDEASMVDVRLMHQLLRAVPATAWVLLVGDVDQLPSVGPGRVLADLIASGVLPVARLREIHRQAGASAIVQAAHAVNQGQEPRSAPPGQGDFYFIEVNEPQRIIEQILHIVQERIPRRFGLDPLRDVQVLSPQVRTELGVSHLNQQLQATLNPPQPGKEEVKRYETTFRVGDKVIQMVNNYQREVFNGDIGRILRLDPVDQAATVAFDGREVEYDYADLDELQLAYAVSIHKSQGSEYPAVVVPLHTQHYVMLQRNLLYTAITRGRRLVVLIGSRKALWRAVTQADTSQRYSRLRARVQAALAVPVTASATA